MSKDIIPFKYAGHQVRVIKGEQGDPWFVAADVCRVLGYRKPGLAVQAHCKGAVKRSLPTAGGPQAMTIIPESDLYRLIMRSNMPDAEIFQDWVTEIVLPSIRKNGGYILGQDKMSDLELLAQAQLVAHKIIEDQKKQLEHQKPKVEAYDHFMSSDGLYSLRDSARVLGLIGQVRTRRVSEASPEVRPA